MERLKDEDGETWYVYDSNFEVDGNTIWVRGIVKDFADQSAFSFALKIAAVAFPGLIISGGRRIYHHEKRFWSCERDDRNGRRNKPRREFFQKDRNGIA